LEGPKWEGPAGNPIPQRSLRHELRVEKPIRCILIFRAPRSWPVKRQAGHWSSSTQCWIERERKRRDARARMIVSNSPCSCARPRISGCTGAGSPHDYLGPASRSLAGGSCPLGISRGREGAERARPQILKPHPRLLCETVAGFLPEHLFCRRATTAACTFIAAELALVCQLPIPSSAFWALVPQWVQVQYRAIP
jgi:hypothetical protein